MYHVCLFYSPQAVIQLASLGAVDKSTSNDIGAGVISVCTWYVYEPTL